MKLKLQNIGIIEEADINVDGITLIAGQNDSGKSTVGKILYALIKGFNQDERFFRESKNRATLHLYQDILRDAQKNFNDDITEFQTKKINDEWFLKIKELVGENSISDDKIAAISGKLDDLKELSEKEFNTIEQKQDEIDLWLNSELDGFANTFYAVKKDTIIEIEDLLGSAKIQEFYKTLPTEKIVTKLDNNLETFYKEAFFIDSPLIINESLQGFVGKENSQSVQKSSQDELAIVLANERTDNLLDYSKINKKISQIINGEITIDQLDGVSYKKNNKSIDIRNTAVGIKSFGIIQLLLKNNRLNNRSLLIIDEPEVHLHPTWQVKYAEILVVLSKEYDIPFVLTSHSPYFIEALERYSKKYKYEKSTNFYFAQKNNDGLSSKIINVTEDIMPILNSISDAFYEIQDINDED